jgi:hypothetical protein
VDIGTCEPSGGTLLPPFECSGIVH